MPTDVLMPPRKKPKSPRSEDRHKPSFVMRLPKSYQEKVRELARRTRRTLTAEVQIALDAHLKANGIEPPA